MDPTSRPAAPSDVPERRDPGSALLQYLPVSRHRRRTDAELAEQSPLANATFIRVTIIFTVLFILAMTALIWYRWYPVTLPTSSIHILGDESLAGAVATIGQNGQQAYSVTLDKDNHYTAVVWLSPGAYDVGVTKNDRVIQRTNVTILPRQTFVDNLLKLSGTSPATDTATQPAKSPGSGY